MFAYFNELSANGSIQEGSLPMVIKSLVECIKALSEKRVSGINLDKRIGQYQLTANRWFLDVLDDKTIVDDDMKSLILDMMTTIENPMHDLEEEDFMQATYNGENCIGLGLASEEINNTFTVSLSSAGWNETSYQIILQKLSGDENGDLVEQDIESSCITIVAPGVTLREKCPSKSVITPLPDFPFSITLAPITGPEASTTIPVIFFVAC